MDIGSVMGTSDELGSDKALGVQGNREMVIGTRHSPAVLIDVLDVEQRQAVAFKVSDEALNCPDISGG